MGTTSVKIVALNLARMKNSVHFDFMNFVMRTIGKYPIIEERFDLLVEAFEAKFANEDHAYLNLDRSFLSSKITEVKAVREVKMRSLRDLVKVYLTDSDSQVTGAAEILLKVIEGYGGLKITNIAADAQSGIYTNLVDDFESKYSEQVQLLTGVEGRLQELKEANNLYLDLTYQRTQFDAEIGKSLMEDARQDMDNVYRALIESINAMITIGHGAEFSAFVSVMNIRIEEERRKLGQGSSKPEEGEEVEPVEVTLTFEKSDESVVTLTGMPGESYEIPPLVPGCIWVKKEGELVAPNGIFPAEDMTFIEVPVGEMKAAGFHFTNGNHETFYGLPGTEYIVPASSEGYYWEPQPTGRIPQVDTQYFETVVPELDERPKYRITFRADGRVVAIQEYYEGETIVPPACPEGFEWPDDLPEVMPARNFVVVGIETD